MFSPQTAKKGSPFTRKSADFVLSKRKERILRRSFISSSTKKVTNNVDIRELWAQFYYHEIVIKTVVRVTISDEFDQS